MLNQGIIQIGESVAFIDNHSDLCIDGKPCDTLGDLIYETNGKRIKESDFKQYRHLSPQFRQLLIEEYFIQNDMPLSCCSVSCSKCHTVAIDEAFWIFE